MSIAVLNEVYAEARRLSIAGSVVAPGDFRLKKLIEPLKKAGTKAPVFSKVAECVEEVVNSSDKTAASSLLNLTSLVCSILFTQGSMGAEGKLEPIKSSAVAAKRSQISARMLKPLIEALTSTGSGRLEQIRSAIDLGLFSDLRLVRPSLKAIDDVYGDIADLIADKVLPMYGKAILSELKTAFDCKGKTGHARRLRTMHRIDPEFAREIIKESLETGSPEVKVAAIECLGNSPDDLSYLIEQAKAKAKDVRRAAYHALGKLDSTAAQEILTQAMDGKDLELVASALNGSQSPVLGQNALDRIKMVVEELPTIKDKKKQGEALVRCAPLFSILGDNLNPAAEKYLQSLVESQENLLKIKSSPGGQDLIDTVVSTLAGGSEQSLKFLVERRDQFSIDGFVEVFSASMKTMKPKEFYKTFGSYINRNAKKNSPEHLRHKAVVEGLQDGPGFHWGWINSEPRVKLDDAWIDDAILADDFDLVTALATPKHANTIKYFSGKLADLKSLGKNVDLNQFAFALIQVEHPQATSFVLDNVKAQIKKKVSYEIYNWLSLAGKLGTDAIPDLEAMIGDPKLSDTISNRLIDTVAEIRERHPAKNS